MNKLLISIFLIIPLSLCAQKLASTPETYQVISQDPHHVAIFKPYIRTLKIEGRQWLVQIGPNTPIRALKYLRKVQNNSILKLNPLLKSSISALPKNSILKQVNNLSPERIKNDVITLSSFNSRSAGTEGNISAGKLISERFKQLGFEVSESCYNENRCSVIADKVGVTQPNEVILVMAHFDSVGKLFAGSDDNASGVSVLMEIAHAVKSLNNKRTIRFFATNGEELGLLGAKDYVKKLQASQELAQIKLAVNMDMVGYNSNGIVELETNKPFEKLAIDFAALAKKYTSLNTKITLGAWGSDHVPFLEKNVPTILTIEDWSTKTPCYHQACDKPDTLNYQYATEIGKLNLAAIMEFDQTRK
jgi:hypothetical protein